MMVEQEPPVSISLQTAICGELLIGLLAIVVCLAMDQKMPDWDITLANTFWGIAATTMMLLGVWFSLRTNWKPVVKLRSTIVELLPMLIPEPSIGSAVLLGASAGIGEELLFRGLIQPAIEKSTGPFVALVIASVLFGLMHAISWEYFWMGTLIGVILGTLLLITGGLWASILCHGLYDIVTIIWILRMELNPKNDSHPAANASV